MKKISSAQLITLLFVTRTFLSITYGVSENRINVLLSMLSILTSAVIQLVLVIPPLIFNRCYQGQHFLDVAFCRSKALGTALSLGYGLFFMFEAARNLGFFSYFLINEFSETVSAFAVILILGAVAIYGASLEISTLARTSAVAVFIFAVMFFVVIFGVTGNYDILNLQTATPIPKDTTRGFFKDVFDKIGRSDDLVALPFLLSHVNKNSEKGTYFYLFIKLLVMETMIVASALALGEFAFNLALPFYTLSTYAKTSIVERYDSIYMCVWTIDMVIKLSVLVYLAGVCLSKIRVRKPNIFAGLIPTALALVLSFTDSFDSVFFKAPSVYVIIILASVLPLILSLSFNKKEELS